MIVEYSSNNSGGNWWLSTEDWKNLEKAGWKVEWHKEFLGAIATYATIEAHSVNDAIEQWEIITGQDAEEIGCPCCGQPHYFFEKKNFS